MKLRTLFLFILVKGLFPFLFILQHFHPWDSYRLKKLRRFQFIFSWSDILRFMIKLIDVDLLWNSKLPFRVIIDFLGWLTKLVNLALRRNLHIIVALCVEFLILLFINFDSCCNLKNTSRLSVVRFFVLLLAVLLIFGVSFWLCNG